METKVKIEGNHRGVCEYVDVDKLFFTSDTHFGHGNVIKFNDRPFKDANHMNEEMIKLWNSVVPVDGHVFHLGDVSLMSERRSLELLNRLNGKIYLLKGNHEKSVLRKQSTRDRFEWVKERFELYVPDEGVKQLIVMSHYGHRVWNKSHHGSWHLYGHSHGHMEHTPWGRSMDVGVDCHDYKPISYFDVKRVLSKREFKEVDKHVERKG
jgi:calcineurin-like phosphoesterase family protein